MRRLVGFVLLVLCCNSTSHGSDKQLPATEIGRPLACSFDSIAEIATPKVACCVAVFCRTQVSRNAVKIDIVWAEPHWKAVPLPFYPVSARLYMSEESSYFGNQYRQEHVDADPRNEPRRPLKGVIGAYNPLDQQHTFADRKKMSIPLRELPHEWTEFNPFEAREFQAIPIFERDQLAYLGLKDRKSRLRSVISYRYSNELLNQQTVGIGSRSTWLNDSSTRKNILISTPARQYEVDWDTTSTGHRFPVQVSARGNPYGLKMQLPSGELFKSRHSNFQICEPNAITNDLQESVPAILNPDEIRWMKLRSRLWSMNKDTTPTAEDLTEIRRFRAVFSERFQSTRNHGDRLRYLNFQVMNALILQDRVEFERAAKLHFDEIAAAGISSVAAESHRQLCALLKQRGLDDYIDVIPPVRGWQNAK